MVVVCSGELCVFACAVTTTTLVDFVPTSQIPIYGLYLLYTKIVVPFVLGGRDPLAGLVGAFSGKRGGSSSTSAQPQTQEAAEQMSKRQKKLQARADRGDPRIQTRQVKRGA